ncbi:uncharacterized protein F4822DRAFT_146327 [Hypoxylon trugodes]|uniref:uncharacterized protein n=1 Tax=Hypoxylon trugodes TaxID=326681 RepID=UPI00218F8CAB|nr:uncharacterized protein F4822DRAFT_146327 [Hypoxylon trugodes]KAI1392921.1 hypothetical protein F4822DRAFT_146327 [Hypoxylon trugodes]
MINDYLSLLGNQINALNLLLTALHCRSTFDQNNLLQEDKSREIFCKVKDDTSSLVCLTDSESNGTRRSDGPQDLTLLNNTFAFDGDLFSSKAYRRPVVRAIRTEASVTKDLRHSQVTLDNCLSVSPPVSSTKVIREEEKVLKGESFKPLVRTARASYSQHGSSDIEVIQEFPASWRTTTGGGCTSKKIPSTGNDLRLICQLALNGTLTPTSIYSLQHVKREIVDPPLFGDPLSFRPPGARVHPPKKMRVNLLGTSRCGKSTLLRCLLAKFRPYDEEVLYLYRPIIRAHTTNCIQGTVS